MECLVTLCWPLVPPTPSKTSTIPPENKESYYTYGAHVATGEYDFVDEAILAMVVRCQANFPEDRPRLETLEEYVLNRVNTSYAGESDEDTLAWMNKILYEVPPGDDIYSSSSQSGSDGPPGTLGTGPIDPPKAIFYRKSAAIQSKRSDHRGSSLTVVSPTS